jgi:hypothetical protein
MRTVLTCELIEIALTFPLLRIDLLQKTSLSFICKSNPSGIHIITILQQNPPSQNTRSRVYSRLCLYEELHDSLQTILSEAHYIQIC